MAYKGHLSEEIKICTKIHQYMNSYLNNKRNTKIKIDPRSLIADQSRHPTHFRPSHSLHRAPMFHNLQNYVTFSLLGRNVKFISSMSAQDFYSGEDPKFASQKLKNHEQILSLWSCALLLLLQANENLMIRRVTDKDILRIETYRD